jgi:nucleoside-diphosphate-sugar epimerase
VYGPGDVSPQGQLVRQYLERKLTVIPRGMALCWGHVADTARGHLLAMERGQLGECYIIAGQPASLTEVLAFAERITGIPAPTLRVAPELVRLAAEAAALVERVVPLPETMSSEYLRVAAGGTYLGSNAKAARELAFTVRPLPDGLRETLEYELRQLQR